MRGNVLVVNNTSIMTGLAATCSPLLHTPWPSPGLSGEPGVIPVVPDDEILQKRGRPDGVKGQAVLRSSGMSGDTVSSATVDVRNTTGGITLDAALRSVSRVREHTREGLGGENPVVDDVMLIASELMTNALVHSDSKNGGQITFAVVLLADLVRVSVTDAGGPTVPRALPVDQAAEGGRGLQLVAALCENWGVCEVPGDRRTVWAEIKTDK